jgi:ABC-type nitrate/sulfonate/bicarbonate transport system substrate-binding protein
MKTRRRSIVAGAALAALAFSGGTAKAQLQDVTMAMPSVSLSYAMAYIADAEGLWEKHGLRLKMLVITGVGATNATIAGSVDFSHGSGASLTRAVARGQKLIAIVGVLQRTSIDIVLRKSLARNCCAGIRSRSPASIPSIRFTSTSSPSAAATIPI